MGRSKKLDGMRVARALLLYDFFEYLEKKSLTRQWMQLTVWFDAESHSYHSAHIRFGNGVHHHGPGHHHELSYSLLEAATSPGEWTNGYVFPIDEPIDSERYTI